MQNDARFRKAMVDGQIKPNRIVSGQVQQAFLKVKRELFCSETHITTSIYRDSLIQQKNGRALLAPLTIAHMLQAAAIKPDESVLVITSGLGYTAALISTYVNHVFAQDLSENLTNPEGDIPLTHFPVTIFPQPITEGPCCDADVIIIDSGEVESWPHDWKAKRLVGIHQNRIRINDDMSYPWDVWHYPTKPILPEFQEKPTIDWLAP